MNTQKKPTLKEFLCDMAVWRSLCAWVVVGSVCLALSNTLTARI
jgi:hypothetical protein